ncbi:hypothetical protein K6Y31_02990 [Motilimonas cestriensis]|uniref:Phage protein n=1 Tax=Motilimonas cestriensis TaxID=2742685 RepID=A0ABS8W5V6_9GAMM|nr:hypothetical protein [Motilimonas cestriensis]MCE2593777.1 hypothetical protein [Motilimonas cestriensis]
MNENEYAKHMISWIEKLGIPDIEVAQKAFSLSKTYWNDGVPQKFDVIKQELWSWVDLNGGPRLTDNSDMTKVRMILCIATESVHEVQDMGFFEDLLVSLGYSYKEAYEGS